MIVSEALKISTNVFIIFCIDINKEILMSFVAFRLVIIFLPVSLTSSKHCLWKCSIFFFFSSHLKKFCLLSPLLFSPISTTFILSSNILCTTMSMTHHISQIIHVLVYQIIPPTFFKSIIPNFILYVLSSL